VKANIAKDGHAYCGRLGCGRDLFGQYILVDELPELRLHAEYKLNSEWWMMSRRTRDAIASGVVQPRRHARGDIPVKMPAGSVVFASADAPSERAFGLDALPVVQCPWCDRPNRIPPPELR